MKQKILDIMDDKIFIEYYGIHGKGHAAEEIAQMMCDKIAECMFDMKASSIGRIISIMIDNQFSDEQIENAIKKLK